METKERLKVCKTCLNRGFNPKVGIICAKSGRTPEFTITCKDFSVDEIELKKIEQENAISSLSSDTLTKDGFMFLLTALLMIIGFLFAWDNLYYGDIDAGMAKYSIAVYWSAIPILRIGKMIVLQSTFYVTAIINLLFFSLALLGTYGSSEFKFVFTMYLGIMAFYTVGHFKIRKLGKARKLKAKNAAMKSHFTNNYYNG